MLEMKPNCECCDEALPSHQAGAFICSYECTYCADCTENKLAYQCPNCGGILVQRPVRKQINENP